LYANYHISPGQSTFEHGRDFFRGLMQKAFPIKPGEKQHVVTAVERKAGGLAFEISVSDKTMRVGPFAPDPSDPGFQRMHSYAESWILEPKNVQKH